MNKSNKKNEKSKQMEKSTKNSTKSNLQQTITEPIEQEEGLTKDIFALNLIKTYNNKTHKLS